MNNAHTAEEVRAALDVIARCYEVDGDPPRWAVDTLREAYAARLEQDEQAKPVASVSHDHRYGWGIRILDAAAIAELPHDTKLFTHPSPTDADALAEALRRTEANFLLAVQGKPVRGMAENLAENAAAQAAQPAGEGVQPITDIPEAETWFDTATGEGGYQIVCGAITIKLNDAAAFGWNTCRGYVLGKAQPRAAQPPAEPVKAKRELPPELWGSEHDTQPPAQPSLHGAWKFDESQRESVCLGRLCPACLGTNIKCVGCVPTPTEANMAFECADCGEQWEGY